MFNKLTWGGKKGVQLKVDARLKLTKWPLNCDYTTFSFKTDSYIFK